MTTQRARTLRTPLMALALGATAVGGGGCGLIFTSSSTPVVLQTDPPGADVYIDGQPFGKTPLTVQVSNRQNHTVTFQLGRGAPAACNLTASAGVGWVLLDVFAALLPVIVDGVTDGWTTLDQHMCYARLSAGAVDGAPQPVAALPSDTPRHGRARGRLAATNAAEPAGTLARR